MPLFGRDRNRIIGARTQALNHPMRLRILELFTEDTTRSLAAAALAPDLASDFPEVRVSQVAYHVARLKDVRLIQAKG